VNYLLDVNVLVAWGWSDHVDHERTVAWIGAARRRKTTRLMTSTIPELGFVRVSVQRTAGRVTVAEATETLAGMMTALGTKHDSLPTTRPSGSSRSGVLPLRAQPTPICWNWPQRTEQSWPRSTRGSRAHFSFPAETTGKRPAAGRPAVHDARARGGLGDHAATAGHGDRAQVLHGLEPAEQMRDIDPSRRSKD
jgi:hypothetical protein